MKDGAPSDTELALAVKGGDRDAFDELVRRHQGRVYAVAYRMTGNREDALDVAQDALVKAYRKIALWEPSGEFSSWLLRLTSNQAVDHLRRKIRRKEEGRDWATDEDRGFAHAPGVTGPGRRAEAGEIESRVQLAMQRLTDMQRTVFVLRHYEGLKLNDIAEQLGCTVGTVKVHLFRALKKLQGELGDLHETVQARDANES